MVTMLSQDTRNKKDSREILEELISPDIVSTFCLEDDFADMQVLIYNILQQMSLVQIDSTKVMAMLELEQVCMSILDKIYDLIK